MAKEGSTIGGLMDVIGTETSLALQYGVPLDALVNKFSHARFEPSGWTSNPDIPHAKSVVDYIFRFMGNTYLPGYKEAHAPKHEGLNPAAPTEETPTSSEVTAAGSTKLSAAAVATAPVSPVLPKSIGTNGQGSKGHAVGNAPSAISASKAYQLPLLPPDMSSAAHNGPQVRSQQFARFQSDAPACDSCGAITVRNGNCYLCHNCGQSMGCS